MSHKKTELLKAHGINMKTLEQVPRGYITVGM